MTLKCLAFIAAVTLAASAADATEFSIIHQFPIDATDGPPSGFLVLDVDGTIYGTTNSGFGGSGASLFALGYSGVRILSTNFSEPTALAVNSKAVYVADVSTQELHEINRNGHQKVIYQFQGGNGNSATGSGDPNTFGPFSFDANGDLVGGYFYADTGGGCAPDGTDVEQCGAFFKLTLPTATTPAAYTNVGALGGGTPLAGPLAPDGTVSYFAQPVLNNLSDQFTPSALLTFSYGNDSFAQVASLQKLKYPGYIGTDAWTMPQTYPVTDSNGNSYGLFYAGPKGAEKLYRISPSGVVTTVHTFSKYADVAGASGDGYAVAPDNTIYGYISTVYVPGTGTTAGHDTPGFIFEIRPDGSYHVLHKFTGSGDGGYPFGQLLLSPSGALFGVAFDARASVATAFELVP